MVLDRDIANFDKSVCGNLDMVFDFELDITFLGTLGMIMKLS